MTVNVLILAGAQNKGELKELSSSKHEALIKIGNASMLEYVVKAACKAETTGKVAVIGPMQDILQETNADMDILIKGEDTLKKNICKGMEVFKEDNYVLLMTSDIPLVTAEVIDDFVNNCLSHEKADVYYPIIPKEKNKSKYPGVQRTYFHLSEGVFTGGNMTLTNPRIFKNNEQLLEKAITLRKNPWKLSKLLGMKFILKFTIGRLSIKDIENIVNKITGCRGHFMITEHPEIGFDIDKPSDLELMRENFI